MGADTTRLFVQIITKYLAPQEAFYDEDVLERQVSRIHRLRAKGDMFHEARVDDGFNGFMVRGVLHTSPSLGGIRASLPGLRKLTSMNVREIGLDEGAKVVERDVEATLLYAASRLYSSIGHVTVSPLAAESLSLVQSDEPMSAGQLRAGLAVDRPWLELPNLVD
jgi:hypothetical protein